MKLFLCICINAADEAVQISGGDEQTPEQKYGIFDPQK